MRLEFALFWRRQSLAFIAQLTRQIRVQLANGKSEKKIVAVAIAIGDIIVIKLLLLVLVPRRTIIGAYFGIS